jgi:polysaccharide deacetylase 2 family uncharacterized protein YibQ
MAIKDTFNGYLTRGVLFRVGLWSLSLISVLLLVLLWLSGASDTKEAVADGRRLLIQLENGAIEGKQISLETLEPAKTTSVDTPEATAVSTVAKPATTPSEAASKPAEQPAAHSTEPAAKPEAKASEAAASLVAQTDMGIKPSSVPPAVVKDELIEKTDAGNLPVIGPKGLKPWSYYAKRYAHKGNLPTIAIIITGLGQNRTATEAAIKLPENMSLSFSPYAKEAVNWANAARIAGHEIFVDLPLEPSNFPASDPGPYGLLVGKGLEENNTRLKWLMSRLEGYVGFVTPLNESFSNNDAVFKELLDQLTARGLMIAMPHEPARNDTRKIIDISKTPYSIADILVDEELSAAAIQARLQLLEKTASKRGFAIGVAQAYPISMQQLGEWSNNLEKKGFTLVPLSFITKIKFPAS